MTRVLAALLLVAVACVLAVAVVGWRERPAPADLIVVLGSQLHHGAPSRRLAARLGCGLALWRAHEAATIMVSGGTDRGGLHEARAMRDWLEARGVPATAIVVDDAGHNTWHTARNARAWLQAHGGTRAIAVSQYFHLLRCRLAFRRAGIAHVSCAWPRFFEWRDLYSTAREVPALVKYALRPAGSPE